MGRGGPAVVDGEALRRYPFRVLKFDNFSKVGKMSEPAQKKPKIDTNGLTLTLIKQGAEGVRCPLGT